MKFLFYQRNKFLDFRSVSWHIVIPVLIIIFSFISLAINPVLGDEEVVLNRGGVILRTGMGNFYPLVTVLSQGCHVKIIERNKGWIRIETTENSSGWISETVLTDSKQPGHNTRSMLKEDNKPVRQVQATSLTAMIKGLSAKLNVNTDSQDALRPVRDMPTETVVTFRHDFTPQEFESPISAGEIGLALIPEMLAVAPVISAQQVEEWGGEIPAMSDYGTLVLLWIAERSGANNFMSRCIVAREGNNAISLPGGWIVVGGSLFSSLSDESELAGVIAHEMFHCVFNHGRKALEKDSWRAGVDDVFAELEAETRSASDEELDLESFANEVREQACRRWSIEDEIQADSAATIWIARCGYDPGGLLRVLEKMRARFGDRLTGHGGITLSWLNSKDELDKRIKVIKKLLKKKRLKHPDKEKQFIGRFRRYTGF